MNEMRLSNRARCKYVIAASIVAAAVGGAAAAWQAKASQDDELRLAAEFLGAPAEALQLAAAGPSSHDVPPVAGPEPMPVPSKGRAFTVLYTGAKAGSPPEKIELVADADLSFVAAACWVDALNEQPTAGKNRLEVPTLQARAQEFLIGHVPLPGVTPRLTQTHPVPPDTPYVYMFEWELLGADGKWPQARALVAVSVLSGRVVMYRYSAMDATEFGRIAVSREKAVATALGLLPAARPGVKIRLDHATLSDRSLWTKRGRPVWQVFVIVTFADPRRMPEPCVFVVDAISGKTEHSSLPGTGAPPW